jgi:hypothetical protein
MRIPRVLGGGLAAAVCASAWLVAGPGMELAAANCMGPQLTVAPSTTPPGGSVTVTGTLFGNDCNDAGGPGPALGQPLEDVEIWIRVGESEKQVAVVDAGPDYAFVVQVVVPPSQGAGSGTVTASTGGFWASPASAAIEVEGVPLRDDDPPVLDAGRFAASTGSGSDPGGSDPKATAWRWALAGAFGGAALTLGVVAVVRRRPS